MSGHDDMMRAGHRIISELKTDGPRRMLEEIAVLLRQLDEYRTSHAQQLAYQGRMNARIAALVSEVETLQSAQCEQCR